MNKITITAYEVVKNQDDTTSLKDIVKDVKSLTKAFEIEEKWRKKGYCNITIHDKTNR